MPNLSDVPRPLIALIYNAAAMRRLDPELDLAKRTPGQVDDGNELVFGSDCAAAFGVPSLFGEPQRQPETRARHLPSLRGVLPRGRGGPQRPADRGFDPAPGAVRGRAAAAAAALSESNSSLLE